MGMWFDSWLRVYYEIYELFKGFNSFFWNENWC